MTTLNPVRNIGSLLDYSDEFPDEITAREVAKAFFDSPIITDYSQVRNLFETTLERISQNYPENPSHFTMKDREVKVLTTEQIIAYDPRHQPTFYAEKNSPSSLNRTTNSFCKHNGNRNFTLVLPFLPRPLFFSKLAHEYGHTLLDGTCKDRIREEQIAITFQEYFLRELCASGEYSLEEAMGIEKIQSSKGLKRSESPGSQILILSYPKNSLHDLARERMRRLFRELRNQPNRPNNKDIWLNMLDIATGNILRQKTQTRTNHSSEVCV